MLYQNGRSKHGVRLSPSKTTSGIVVRRAVENIGDLTDEVLNYELGVDSMNRPYAQFGSRGNVANRSRIEAPVEISNFNEWNHLAASFDNNSQTLKLYVNTFLVAESTFDSDTKSPSTGNEIAQLSIGGGVDGGGPVFEGFVGWIDEVRIWSVGTHPSRDHFFLSYRDRSRANRDGDGYGI